MLISSLFFFILLYKSFHKVRYKISISSGKYKSIAFLVKNTVASIVEVLIHIMVRTDGAGGT